MTIGGAAWTLPAEAALTRDPMEIARCAINGVRPSAVAFPETPAAVAATLKAARDQGLAVVARGGGFHQGYGCLPKRLELVLSTERLTRIVAYDVKDLTMTVEAGVTLQHVADVAHPNRQFLPIDPGPSPHATIGGVLAAGMSGPYRHLFGPARDQVLGMTVALPGGILSHCGGRVVKNVAGYDLMRLFTGSLGTLGVLCEVTLRLQPKPVSRRTLAWAFSDSGDAVVAAEAMLADRLSLARLEVLGARAAGVVLPPGEPAEGALLLADLWGPEATLAAHERRACHAMAAGTHMEVPHVLASGMWREVMALGGTGVVVRLSMGQSLLAEALELVDRFSAEQGTPLLTWAEPGSGVLRVGIDAAEGPPPEKEIAVIQVVLDTFRGRGAVAVIERLPGSWQPFVDVWGPDRPEYELGRAVKAALDPESIMAPGRFAGGW